ncbi:hypothetical protein NUU61_001281 [Penicillium alfredii]|uniref:AAA+ ATPase domain-containing protein n=1 Tax=Penicillium alfredii TaxID=1506179 RepID=A0A9W9GC81_9EURO|nr:uncharacterized protein NUU61_001281 [Penicillium alfredii]KAJ5115522.1 hypothetical protein NUU61_001281 [Penicillium alfredii]
MASKTSSPCHEGLTPPDSPRESPMPLATLNDLKHLFGVFLEKALLEPTSQVPPNTPVSQHHSQPGPDMAQLKQLLVKLVHDRYPSVETIEATRPAQSCFVSNEQQGNSEAAEAIDLESPIRTTPDDFKSFEKWASQRSAPQFKKIVETWDKDAYKYKVAESVESSNDQDDLCKYVFVVRERVDRKSEEVTPYIDIKSEWLRDILRGVMQNIKAISLMENEPSIEQNILFHFLAELEEYAEGLKNDPKFDIKHIEHLGLLIEHLKYTYASTSHRLHSMLQHSHITYDLLWALFKPGSHVFATCFGTGEQRCVVFDAGQEMTQDNITFFNLECRFLDYDGVRFGEAGIFLRILKFRGSKPIKELEAFPLYHHPNHEQIRKDLIKSGQKFRDLAGSHIQYCNGSAFFMKNGKPIKLKINSRVGVDAAFFRKMQPNYSRPRLHDIWAERKDGIAIIDFDTFVGNDREQEKEKMQEGSVDAHQMGESDLLICCPTVCCFSFKEKMFLECAAGALADVQWSPGSFECLKIPSKTKTLLSSLAKTRLDLVPTLPFDDIIDGKGRGLNILLHGPPGVGKTFTVEATAERFNLPLYSISAGELVVDHGDSNALEQQLENIFTIAKHFNAVLLLDEADAFMEQRTSYHDNHNRLVTVFLRKLEYYQGILFLTTNRMIQFDEAIISRIHLTIKYQGLTREFRREIWKNLLSKAQTIQGPAIVGHDELQLLDNFSLNGREIKNLTSIAHALATVEEQPVSYKYLEMAAESNEKLSEKFGQESRVESMYV